MSKATLTWISGPVLRARAHGPFRLREAIRVGPQALLGEVIRLGTTAASEPEIVAQVYEDTTGLRPGVELEGTGELLGIVVGPHLLGRMFDGLLRPLADAEGRGARHVLPGAGGTLRAALRFAPTLCAGDALRPGAPFG
ncbi:MAG: hypothetical protein ACK4V1_13185, partial [Burkholderiaceae bacterium]